MSANESGFFVTGGTLGRDAPSYVERQADRDLLDGLLRGEFCYVLTSRQMGKSSLMVRTAIKLRDQGVHVVVMDLTAVGQNLTPEQWYDGLIVQMGRSVGLEDELEAYWRANRRLGPCQRLFAAMRDVVMTRRAGALVVFVDEIDAVRSLPFSLDEFFAAIRECYNRRAEDGEFNRLAFCLLGVATPSDLIRDTRTTPFNIGRRIELHDFTPAEAAPLAQGLRDAVTSANDDADGRAGGGAAAVILKASRLLTRILYWTGGHPYLTQRFCRAVAEDEAITDTDGVDRLCEKLFLSSRAQERDDNLLFVRERLLRSEVDVTSLLQLYLRVRGGNSVADDDTSRLISVLRLAGVVTTQAGYLRERSRIYSRVFDAAWVQAHLPDADLRRQKAAFRRGVFRTTAIAAVVVAALTIAVLFAQHEAEEAEKALALASFSQAKTERMSGRPGRRTASLAALERARVHYPNEAELRNEAIASLALLDLRKGPEPPRIPPSSTAVALNQGLTRYAVGDSDGAINLVETESNRLVTRLPSNGYPISWLGISPDGRFVSAQYDGGDEHRLVVWDVSSTSPVLSLTNRVLPSALDFSGDSSRLAVGLPEGHVGIFDLPGGKAHVWLPLRTSGGEIRAPLCVRLDYFGRRLAESSRASQNVQIWNLNQEGNTNRQETPEMFHPSAIIAMAWSPNGHHLATATDIHDVYVWDVRVSEIYRQFPPVHSDAIVDLAFNSSGNLLASLGEDRSLKLWNTATGRHLACQLETESPDRLHFSQDGRRLGSAGVKPGVHFWEILGSEAYQVFRGSGEVSAPFNSLCFSPEGRLVVAANKSGVYFWDATTGRESSFLDLRATKSVLMHPVRGDLLASTSFGFYRWRQQMLSGVQTPTLQFGGSDCLELPARLGQCAWGPAATQAAVVHEEHIHLVNSEGSFPSSTLPFKGPFDALTTSPDGRWLVTWKTNQNGLIEVWDLAGRETNARPVHVIPGFRHFAFSPEGGILVTCSSRLYQFWDASTWRDLKIPLAPSHSGDAYCVVAFARAGSRAANLLALASSATTIRLFRVSDGWPASLLELATLESPDPTPLVALAFNHDGSRLAAAAADQTVQVWNLAKLRDELARMKLSGDLPSYSAKAEGPLTVVIANDTLDTTKPETWQKVETLTAALASASESGNRTVLTNLLRRGRYFLDLRQPTDAKRDFEEALRLSPNDPDLHDLLRKAEAALKDTAKPVPGKKQSAVIGSPLGRAVSGGSERLEWLDGLVRSGHCSAQQEFKNI